MNVLLIQFEKSLFLDYYYFYFLIISYTNNFMYTINCISNYSFGETYCYYDLYFNCNFENYYMLVIVM